VRPSPATHCPPSACHAPLRHAADRRRRGPQEANFETILRVGFRYSMKTIGGTRDSAGQKFLDAMAGAFMVAFEKLTKQKNEDRKLFKRKDKTKEQEEDTFVELWKLSEALVGHCREAGLTTKDPEIGGRLLATLDPSTGQLISDEKLAAEITILLIAGHETSSHTTSMALGLLMLNPHALEKVEAELER
jgi:cytochrome P450